MDIINKFKDDIEYLLIDMNLTILYEKDRIEIFREEGIVAIFVDGIEKRHKDALAYIFGCKNI